MANSPDRRFQAWCGPPQWNPLYLQLRTKFVCLESMSKKLNVARIILDVHYTHASLLCGTHEAFQGSFSGASIGSHASKRGSVSLECPRPWSSPGFSSAIIRRINRGTTCSSIPRGSRRTTTRVLCDLERNEYMTNIVKNLLFEDFHMFGWFCILGIDFFDHLGRTSRNPLEGDSWRSYGQCKPHGPATHASILAAALWVR